MPINTNPSRTFAEFLIEPGLTTKDHIPEKIDLSTPVTKYNANSSPSLKINFPVVTAAMQAVTDSRMAIAIAKEGGIGFIPCSQTIPEQCKMIAEVKGAKAGFVKSVSNLKPTDILQKALDLKKENGHSTMPVTHDGTANGKLVGIFTSRDYRVDGNKATDPNTQIQDLMTPLEKIHYGLEGISLSEANDIIHEKRLNSIPILSEDGYLRYLVFIKDYNQHHLNPYESLDEEKRYLVGAAVNTRDYKERIPAVLEAGADILCIDASDGFSSYSSDVLDFVRQTYGDTVKIGAGNVVNADGFNFLVNAGADFIKVGIGGGSICITREQKGIGCGQATAVIEVAKERDNYFSKTGIYIPICSDGGIVKEYHVTIALSLGADFVMMGRYFARFDEAPGEKITRDGKTYKAYWGEGSEKARKWYNQRYDDGSNSGMKFEEGVNGYVPYAGDLNSNVEILSAKLKGTMCNCGVLTLKELYQNTTKRLVSSLTLTDENPSHDMDIK